MKLENRTVLVTGGSRGIGLALVEVLCQKNQVIVTGRDAATLKKVKERFHKVATYQSDVADPDQIRKLKAQIEKDFPEMDVLFNNAGVAQRVDLTKPSDDELLIREIEINLKGAIRMVNAFLPLLLAQPEAAIVNVSSGLAYMPFPSQPIYGATKAGLHSYTLSLRSQLAKTSVQVFEVFPPVVETDMTTNVHGYPKMNARKHAERVISSISSGKMQIRPGISQLLYYASRLAPATTLKQLSKHN